MNQKMNEIIKSASESMKKIKSKYFVMNFLDEKHFYFLLNHVIKNCECQDERNKQLSDFHNQVF